MSNVPMTRPDLALATYQQPHSTNNTFLYLGDGRILRVVDGWQFMASDDGGLTWSDPVEHTDPDGDKIGGSGISLAKLDGDSIGLAAMRPQPGVKKNRMMFWRSQDGGQTWQLPIPCSPPLISAHSFPNSIIRTESGRLILALYCSLGQGGTLAEHSPFPGGLVGGQYVTTDAHHFDPHFSAAYIVYSDDDGHTWQPNHDGELFIHVGHHLTAGAPEPTIVEVTPGKLLMFVRTQLGRLYQAWSTDCGQTWTRLAPTALASSASPATLLKMPDTGHLICIWNQHNDEDIRRGFIRTRLSSAISRNGGGVWEFFQNINSIHEKVRVQPGPIRHTYPEELYTFTGRPGVERVTDYCDDLPAGYGRWSNATATVCGDRVLVYCSALYFDENGQEHNRGVCCMQVLPLAWFYGGRDRFGESVVLTKIANLPPSP